jgi:hypothetical protein
VICMLEERDTGNAHACGSTWLWAHTRLHEASCGMGSGEGGGPPCEDLRLQGVGTREWRALWQHMAKRRLVRAAGPQDTRGHVHSRSKSLHDRTHSKADQ